MSDVADVVSNICADQIANLTSKESSVTPAATPTMGAASRLPENLAFTGLVAAMAAVAAALL